VKASDGSFSARYEYGPFAEPIRSSGPLADAQPLRFSTKYTDNESGFLYYGYRYYNPGSGRWLSRDPISECRAFSVRSPDYNLWPQMDRSDDISLENLQSFCANDPITTVDILGLKKRKPSSFAVKLNTTHCKSEVHITYNSGVGANGCQECERPKLAQIVMTIERQFLRRLTHWAVWTLDTEPGVTPWYKHQYPSYGFVVMEDVPGSRWWRPGTWVWGLIQVFETCAVCTDKGGEKILGCVGWGHDVAGIGRATSWGAGENIVPVPPSPDFVRLFGRK
jgi:RHS repeat-associated protein